MPEAPTEFGEGRSDLNTVKRMRREYPSGWLELAKDPARALLIDAILDAPPGYEFSPPEIAPRAGISAQSVRNHIDILVDRGILKQINGSRYAVVDQGKVITELRELNSAVNAVRRGMSSNDGDFVHPMDAIDNSVARERDNSTIKLPSDQQIAPDMAPNNAV